MAELALGLPGTFLDQIDARTAVALCEQLGFDSVTFPDSPLKDGDPFAQATAASTVTSSIVFRIGVVNPVLRDVASVAASAASLQIQSDGRAFVGIGSGYTALALLGLPYPVKLAVLETFANQLRTYLHGGTVDRGGRQTGLTWLPPGFVAPPIELVCSGPRSIEVATRTADCVCFALGSRPEAVAWAVGQIEAGLDKAGRKRSDIEIATQLPIWFDDGTSASLAHVTNLVAMMAGFGVRSGTLGRLYPDLDDDARDGIVTMFETRGESGAIEPGADRVIDEAGEALAEAFVREFALFGTPSDLVDQLAALERAGVDRVHLVMPRDRTTTKSRHEALTRLSTEVVAPYRARVAG